MEPAIAAQKLRDVALPERAGEKAMLRLEDVLAVFRDDLGWIDAELGRAVVVGPSPAIDAARHLYAAGGKRVRPLCVLLASACFGEVSPVAKSLAVAAELVHIATLLHDDVFDDGSERRGIPTARRIWGNAVSVLAGDLLLTHALERTAHASPGPVLTELFSTLRSLVDGEIVQLRGRTRLDLAEATYFGIVQDKTASLFRWAARSGARAANAPADAVDALGEFGGHLGVAFQLVDDALDYADGGTGKDVFADLREGKLTLPLLRAVAGRDDLVALLASAREGHADAAAQLLEAVRASRAVDEARAVAREETRAALAALERVPVSPARDLLAAVARELTSRAT
ncbi:polyprenyl synthetase family protein [soil metagenome]